jgi:hypothetical protein
MFYHNRWIKVLPPEKWITIHTNDASIVRKRVIGDKSIVIIIGILIWF